MNIELLLQELEAQDNKEQEINNCMQLKINKANALIDELKEKWKAFVREAFPEKIVDIMCRLRQNGFDLRNFDEPNADHLYPIISIQIDMDRDLHIVVKNKNLVFVQGNKTIGFYVNEKDSPSYRNNGHISWNSLPVTLWRYLPMHIELNKTESGMKRNREAINLVYEFNQMFLDFQNALPEIYSEIARLNAEYVDAKRKTIAVKEEAPEPKKFRITVEVEEI